MDGNMENILNDFRKMKINYDIERFRLMLFQLENLIKDYDNLIKTREEIQEKYFRTIESLNENEFEIDVKYGRWSEVRLNENTEWKNELDELTQLKYVIEETLELLKNGEIERLLIEEEEKLL